jgi:hypothetical protein
LHEYTIWAAHDRHASAYETLANTQSKAIGDKLKIADVKTSDSCLSCHALNVPKELQGENYSIREGNSCDNCHGPSEKWIKPHIEKGWMQAQRERFQDNHEGMLKEWGIYDTRPLAARAAMCTSCHLSIDADMVAAGHPQPTFELDWFQELEPKHWMDRTEPYWSTKVWLAGQVACLRDSMNQLATRAAEKKDPAMVKAAYDQAMSHLMALKPAASAAGADPGALEENADELRKLIADPAGNADAIAAKASAVAALADAALPKVNDLKPTGQMTLAALSGVANAHMHDLGRFGMDQQALGISSLYNSFSKTEPVAETDSEVINNLIAQKLLPPETGEPNAVEYAKALEELRAKLPK